MKDKKFAEFLKDKMAKHSGAPAVDKVEVEVEEDETEVPETEIIAQELIKAVQAGDSRGVVEAIEAIIEHLKS